MKIAAMGNCCWLLCAITRHGMTKLMTEWNSENRKGIYTRDNDANMIEQYKNRRILRCMRDVVGYCTATRRAMIQRSRVWQSEVKGGL